MNSLDMQSTTSLGAAWDGISGYERSDGRWGSRNHVVVLAAADNVNPLAYKLARANPGVVCVPASFGRGQMGQDFELMLRTMSGFATHPNTSACLVVSYEPEAGHKIARYAASRTDEVQTLSILRAGGLTRALQSGGEILQSMLSRAAAQQRRAMPIDALTIGLECGGSDATSGLFANPAIGLLSDALYDRGATLIFSEPVELVGCEPMTDRRAVNPQVARDIRRAIEKYVVISKESGVDLIETNPTPDNIAGGLSTIEEKSLGAVLKTGTRPIAGVVDYGERPPTAGLWLMDAPAAAVENITALAAAGCQAILFATGTVNPVGNHISPTIKICANPEGLSGMGEHVDVDLSPAYHGKMILAQAAESIEATLVQTLNGALTTSETLGYLETRVSRIGWSV